MREKRHLKPMEKIGGGRGGGRAHLPIPSTVVIFHPSTDNRGHKHCNKQTYTHTHENRLTIFTLRSVVCLTELMANVVSCFVIGLCKVMATTQQPHPPSPHIFLVPVSPGCIRSHALSVNDGDTPCTSTGPPFNVKETDVFGSTDMVSLVTVLPRLVNPTAFHI